ncbi:hypothetical protein [Rhodococcus sp. UNC23MFCrub1.1]|uniref:hypothetical protein n=1 Tax=Rhodococcus sp. UNC23MFCrub1.1 TaxID=1449068 RepID=UPI0012DC4B5B|nr:hypothetical protein [Rhodococcus sp. UNC23MFCrub1.1]
MTEPGILGSARASFDEALDALALKDSDAAVVVLTMARLASQAMLNGDAALAGAAARVVSAADVPTAGSAAVVRTPPSAPRTRTPRAAAVLDPFHLYRTDGRDALRARLAALDLEQLRDIIHQFGMDPDKRAMKWKTISKVRERIVERTESTRNRDRAFH